MTPSITIKIDYGPEGGTGAAGVSSSGSLPTPASSGLAASAVAGQTAAGLPTPLGAAAEPVALAGHAAPAPSPSLVPAGSRSATGVPGLGDLPTPFSTGGFSPTDPSGQRAPTPLDSIYGSSVGEQAPTPHPGEAGPAERTAPVPPAPGEKEKSSKRGKK